MPKIVDHDQRRLELVAATWRIIAKLGIEGATMREIALEAGFANGALKPYFSSKDTLLTFAFGHVFNRTNERIAAVTAETTGLPALRAFCREVLPLDDERIQEARIVIPFWQKALTDSGKAALHASSMEQWHTQIKEFVGEARAAGDICTPILDSVIADHLLNMLLGAQIAAALTSEGQESEQFTGQLDDYLSLLCGGA